MPFKPMPEKEFRQYIKLVGWNLLKGGTDWNLYNEKGNFVCVIVIAHGKNTEKGVKAYSVDKTKKAFKEAGLKWPPKKK